MHNSLSFCILSSCIVRNESIVKYSVHNPTVKLQNVLTTLGIASIMDAMTEFPKLSRVWMLAGFGREMRQSLNGQMERSASSIISGF